MGAGKTLPETMTSPGTGNLLRRGLRPFTVAYLDKSTTVNLPGYYSDDSSESVHVGDDMAITDMALRDLKQRRR